MKGFAFIDPFFSIETTTMPMASKKPYHPCIRAPILAYGLRDDKWESRREVDAMMANDDHARVERRHKTPHDVNGSNIGHFGFFMPTSRVLWQAVDEWIHAVSEAEYSGR